MDPVSLNARVHEALEALWVDAMVALTGLELPAATAAWERFEALIREHARREDEIIFPLFAATGPPPRGAAPEILAGEHDKLAQLTAVCRGALAELTEEAAGGGPEPALRRSMVRRLDHFQRLHHLFEHHTLREETLVYPALAGAAPGDLARIREALTLRDAPPETINPEDG